MHDSYVRAAGSRGKRPFDLHLLCNTPDMSKADRGSFAVHRHLRKPPGRPVDPQQRAPRSADDVKRSECGHLYQSPTVGPSLAEAHVPVVGEMRRPRFHISRQLEQRVDRSTNEFLVHRFHWASDRHRAELERTSGLSSHRAVGAQLAVILNPRRWCTTGFRAIASLTVPASSSGVKPRSTETTPSWRLTA